jgi:hypothetical protein
VYSLRGRGQHAKCTLPDDLSDDATKDYFLESVDKNAAFGVHKYILYHCNKDEVIPMRIELLRSLPRQITTPGPDQLPRLHWLVTFAINCTSVRRQKDSTLQVNFEVLVLA